VCLIPVVAEIFVDAKPYVTCMAKIILIYCCDVLAFFLQTK
jgi:hypothetical protein